MTFKQHYIHQKGPFPFDFEKERALMFEKILAILESHERNQWTSHGVNIGGMIQTYKEVYGLTSHQLQTLLSIFVSILFHEKEAGVQPRLIILKIVNRLSDFQIEITENFQLSNPKLLGLLVDIIESGIRDPLKHQDSYMEELTRFISYFCKYGQQYILEALKASIEHRSIKILACFTMSVKRQESAEAVLEELLKDCSLWERETSWFFVVSELIKRFPSINYSCYYNTLFQEIIKSFTLLIDPSTNEELKKLTENEPCLGHRSITKSIACILSGLLLPQRFAQSQYVWNGVERIFNIITTTLDHNNEQPYILEYLNFIKNFVRYFLHRFRKERKMHLLKNEDFVEDFHGEYDPKDLLIDDWLVGKFNSLWPEIIPRLLFFEDNDSLSARILSDLGMYSPSQFLPLILGSIKSLLQREDLNMISLYTTKMGILFLQEFIFKEHPEHVDSILDCYEIMIDLVEKLGVSENLDILELIFRCFLHMDNQTMSSSKVENLIEQCISIILGNLEAMSVNLEENNQGESTELYLDLNNIYIPFLIRLNKETLGKFADRFMFKMLNEIPESRQTYEYISVIMGLMDADFSTKLFGEIYKRLITKSSQSPQKSGKGKPKIQENPIHSALFKDSEEVLATKNESHVRWYVVIIQCLYQYHPETIVKDFPKIQKVVSALLKEWDNSLFSDLALDTIFNLIIGLSHVHFDWKSLIDPCNNDYTTMNPNWEIGSEKTQRLLVYIYDTYFLKLIDFMKNRFEEKIAAKRGQSNKNDEFVKVTFKDQVFEFASSDLNLVDSLLIPDVAHKNEDLEDKKLIMKVVSIQYTILSGLMIRAPFFQPSGSLGSSVNVLKQVFLREPGLQNIRKTAHEYLHWVMELMQSYNILWEPSNLKVFNFFWRESLDEVYFTNTLNTTIEKLTPFYYPQLFRKKELMRSSFLVMCQSYAIFMARMQFQIEINPVAFLNNNSFVKKTFLLGLNPNFDANLHTYIPKNYNIHQTYREIMSIFRYHFNLSNKKGYGYKYQHSTEKRQKEKYLMTLKMMLTYFKKCMNPLSYASCLKDPVCREAILDTIGLYGVFEQKGDKLVVIELFYLMIVFGFDTNLFSEVDSICLSQWLKVQDRLETENDTETQGFCWIKQKYLVTEWKTTDSHKENLHSHSNILNLTPTQCAYRSPIHINSTLLSELKKFAEQIMDRWLSCQSQKKRLSKQSGVHCLLIIFISKFVPLSDPMFKKVIQSLILMASSEITELFDIGKTGLFYVINRFNSAKKKTLTFPNTPIKRSFQDFLVYRFLGSEEAKKQGVEFYRNVVVDKQENYYYPKETLKHVQYGHLGDDESSSTFSNEMTVLEFLSDHSTMKKFMVMCSHDKDLKQTDTDIDYSSLQEGGTSITNNGHKLLNFILDSNPKKNDAFSNFIENFTLYPLNFYPRLIRKTIRIGGQKVIENFKTVSEELRRSEEMEEVKLSLYVSCELMLSLCPEDQYVTDFIEFLCSCSNEIFEFSNTCLFLMFMKNFVVCERIYRTMLKRMRQEKGSSRLRYLTIINLYLMSQGRFARNVAKEAIQILLEGIHEGSDEVSEVIVTMIVNCFVIAINLKQSDPWIEESLLSLTRKKQIHKLNDWVGYEIDETLNRILQQIVQKTTEEKEIASKNLKIYSKIANKVLGSISVYRYNESFFNALKDMIYYVVEKTPDQGQTDEDLIGQLKDSEYPEVIYKNLIERLCDMSDNPPSVIKKKLKYLESVSINFCYAANNIQVPERILSLENEKIINLEMIVAISNIYRLMTKDELTAEVEKQIKDPKRYLYSLMALLLAAGVREYSWKEEVLREILKHKKSKIVKEFISLWWRGKNPETQQERVLQHLVQGVENPYSYFA